MPASPEVVLVHGLWHQPAHFGLLRARLEAQGMQVRAPRLHRGSLAADTAVVQEVVDACASPPIVVGHSYGGAVITGLSGAGQLIFVAAFVPDAGDSGASLGGPRTPINETVERLEDGSTVVAAAAARATLYQDCDEVLASWATALLVPQARGHGRGTPARVAWRDVPSSYVVCALDRAVDPELQRRMSGRCGSVAELDSGHSPFLSRSEELAALIVGGRAR